MTERKPPVTRVSAANSNTRVSVGHVPRRSGLPEPAVKAPRPVNSNTRLVGALPEAGVRLLPAAAEPSSFVGLRERMVARLAQAGIQDRRVLQAMAQVPRHRFVDEALASRAYENAALPIGSGQTISQPWIVARMAEAALAAGPLDRVLEVGTGCGYQAAVLACLATQVISIERIRSLHDGARVRLASMPWRNVRLILGDGQVGWAAAAPYNAILVAAAGVVVPTALLQQLAPGGRLLAPEGDRQQRLVLIERVSREQFRRTELEAVRFVPLQTGVQL